MKKPLRTALIILFMLGLLGSVALGGLSWWVLRQMGPDFWVSLVEKNTNCRVHVDDTKLSLFSKPARLSFHGVKIGPRDGEEGKPLAERAPMATAAAPITIPEVVLEVKLDDLMNRRLFIEQFRIISPVVMEGQDEQGKSSLESLFKKPRSKDEVPTPPAVANTELQPVTAAETPDEEIVRTKDGLAFAVSNASIENGSLTIQSSSHTTVQIQDLNFNISGFDIDPTDLTNHNRITAKLSSHITINGQARIGGVKRPAQLADLKLSGDSTITPINPTTGEWKPYSVLKLSLDKGSVIAGHITMGDAAGKEMKKLLEYGIDLSPVVVGGPLMEPAIVNGTFSSNTFILGSDTRFVFPEYEVALEKKSYANAAIDKHNIDFRLSCGPELQARLQQGVSKAKLGDSITRGLAKALADEHGRMTFDIESEGKLSDPEIKPKLDRLLKNLMRGEGLNDVLQGIFKKL
ncbi:hypothetical protein [Brevifollis gellanilyticus]|uniref:AsmA-like C-terminal domain-containing protein n=1 Tax=Brevifollis gellanilyticus TaxID=748831 RepID=A0A512MCR6_9BACT|nr:hypothetical protein [Brevifollis gellanilyticus]GEP44534.1 hypothetical protein BGE01nite_38250 [Brevifollis gellanilyticus]